MRRQEVGDCRIRLVQIPRLAFRIIGIDVRDSVPDGDCRPERGGRGKRAQSLHQFGDFPAREAANVLFPQYGNRFEDLVLNGARCAVRRW